MGKLEKLPKINEKEDDQYYTPDEVLERYSRAVECAPDKAGGELLLEPHHKLVSAACKYVLNESIQVALLNLTPLIEVANVSSSRALLISTSQLAPTQVGQLSPLIEHHSSLSLAKSLPR